MNVCEGILRYLQNQSFAFKSYHIERIDLAGELKRQSYLQCNLRGKSIFNMRF